MRNIIKWMICISLVLCVCLGVTACGNADKQQVIKNDETDIGKENDSQSKGDEDTIGNGQMCSVIIKINPHFEIFFNDEYLITQIDCLNADAEQAFSGINVLSMPFDEGVRKLLNALYSKGYIKNSSVQIVWAMKEAENANFDPAMIVNGFEKAIAEFGDENGIGVSVRMVDPNDAALQMGQQLDINSGAPGDDWESLDNITVERDSNGDVISYVETDSNGSKITYNAKKQKIHALIYHDTGYSEICYDESGKITKHTISENDGSEMELFYYASGSKSRVYTVYANDEFRDEYYSENGSRIKFIERRNISNGSYLIDYDTDGNGNADYQYVYKSDGSVWYNEFDMNGNQIPGTQKKIQ